MQTNKLLAFALLAVSSVGMVIGAWSAAQFRLGTAGGPLLVNPRSPISTDDGGALCAVGSQSIHRYDSSGLLVDAWAVPAEGGDFRLRRAAAGTLEVAVESTGRVLSFDDGHQLVSERTDPDAYDQFGKAPIERAVGEAQVGIEDGAIIVGVPDAATRVLVPALPRPLRWFASRPLWIVLLLALTPAGVVASAVALLRKSPEPGPR